VFDAAEDRGSLPEGHEALVETALRGGIHAVLAGFGHFARMIAIDEHDTGERTPRERARSSSGRGCRAR